MAIGCTFCLLPGGPGIGPTKGGVFDEEDEFFDHVEMKHDIPVRRPGESQEEARDRVLAKNPRIGGPECKCPSCSGFRGLLEVGW